MTIQEALDLLKEKNITDSIQMLRRWIRQGKIVATMTSRKDGYVIDLESLNSFIGIKQSEKLLGEATELEENRNYWESEDYQKGWKDAKEHQAALIKIAVEERERELILKGFNESIVNYSIDELLVKFPERAALKEHFKVLKIHKLTLNQFGNWLYDDSFNLLTRIDILPYPNRKFKARAKDWYVQELFSHFEENK